jgi:hypothetical protein
VGTFGFSVLTRRQRGAQVELLGAHGISIGTVVDAGWRWTVLGPEPVRCKTRLRLTAAVHAMKRPTVSRSQWAGFLIMPTTGLLRG